MTEQVTGIDLVREQIRIAAGQPLSFRQEDVRWRGHALQCRVYAEDPRAGFRPAAGPVLLCEPPQGAGIRNDVGVETGDVASVRYDPLLAKLTVWAPDRPAALARARDALRRYALLGVTTNLPLLQAIAAAPAFQRAEWDTGTLERLLPDLLISPPEGRTRRREPRRDGPLLVAAGWRLTAPLAALPLAPGGAGGAPALRCEMARSERVTAWRAGEGWEARRRRHPLHPPLPAHLPLRPDRRGPGAGLGGRRGGAPGRPLRRRGGTGGHLQRPPRVRIRRPRRTRRRPAPLKACWPPCPAPCSASTSPRETPWTPASPWCCWRR